MRPASPRGLIEHHVCLLADFFHPLDCRRPFIGRCTSGLFEQALCFRPPVAWLGQSIGKLSLRFGFGFTQLFIFPQRFKIIDGFSNQRIGCFLNFARLILVMLADAIRLLLHLGELLINQFLGSMVNACFVLGCYSFVFDAIGFRSIVILNPFRFFIQRFLCRILDAEALADSYCKRAFSAC